MAANNNKEYVISEQEGLMANPLTGMRSFKEEVAAEVGLVGYDKMDKGWLASRQNGYVGGNMTKKMVSYAEQAISQQGHQVMNNVKAVIEVSPEVRKLNEMASTNMQNFQQVLYGLQQGGQVENQQLQ